MRAQAKADALREHTEEEKKQQRLRAERNATKIIQMTLGRCTERAFSAWVTYVKNAHARVEKATRSVLLFVTALVPDLLHVVSDWHRFSEQAQTKRVKCVFFCVCSFTVSCNEKEP